MFKNLQEKWNVSAFQLFMILCTFAVTGTTTAFISRSITAWVGFGPDTFWLWKLLLRLFILIFGYQVIILIVSFFFGQFRFFWNYEKKILRRLRLLPVSKVSLAIFASGKGSNAERIIKHFKNHPTVRVCLIVSNKKEAGVLDIAKKNGIPAVVTDKNGFYGSDDCLKALQLAGTTHIVLAGFLWKVPDNLLKAFPKHIVNIHPALLPKFGGKGMYGEHVHQAVLAAGETESGITIHLVDEHYDHGETLFQATLDVYPDDTPESLAERIHILEHEHYPAIIEGWVKG